MNGLSWMLYWSDVVGNLGPLLVIGGVVLCGGALIMAVVGATYRDYARSRDEDDWKSERSLQKKAWAPALFGATLIAAAAFVPSKNTIMLIAASEVGETVIASGEAQKLGGEAGQLATDSLRLLRKYVSDQLAEGEGE